MSAPVRVDVLAEVTDRLAALWNDLSKPEERIPIGNEIEINNHTQNTIVTQIGETAVAYFVPRWRSRLNTQKRMDVTKNNLAVLEVAGYMLIDDPKDWAIIGDERVTAQQRNEFGKGALADIAPDSTRITEFEDELQARAYIAGFNEPDQRRDDVESRIRRVLSWVQRTLADLLTPEVKKRVLREANEKFRTLTAERNELAFRPSEQGDTLFTEETIEKLIAEKPRQG